MGDFYKTLGSIQFQSKSDLARLPHCRRCIMDGTIVGISCITQIGNHVALGVIEWPVTDEATTQSAIGVDGREISNQCARWLTL